MLDIQVYQEKFKEFTELTSVYFVYENLIETCESQEIIL